MEINFESALEEALAKARRFAGGAKRITNYAFARPAIPGVSFARKNSKIDIPISRHYLRQPPFPHPAAYTPAAKKKGCQSVTL